MEQTNQPDVIASVDRALDILLLLQTEGREMGVTQIGTALGMYKSTVYRTLATLEKKNFVRQNPDNGKYWLGVRLYSLGMLVRERYPLKKLAGPLARELADRFQEAVHLAVIDDAGNLPQHIIIEKIESPQVLGYSPMVGSSSPSHCSAMGKCLLAHVPAERLAAWNGCELPLRTPNTISDWDRLKLELDRIRQQGYALDDEEMELGLTCVAAPIFERDGHVTAALSLSGPTSRIRAGRFEEIVNQVRRTAAAISALL